MCPNSWQISRLAQGSVALAIFGLKQQGGGQKGGNHGRRKTGKQDRQNVQLAEFGDEFAEDKQQEAEQDCITDGASAG